MSSQANSSVSTDATVLSKWISISTSKSSTCPRLPCMCRIFRVDFSPVILVCAHVYGGMVLHRVSLSRVFSPYSCTHLRTDRPKYTNVCIYICVCIYIYIIIYRGSGGVFVVKRVYRASAWERQRTRARERM